MADPQRAATAAFCTEKIRLRSDWRKSYAHYFSVVIFAAFPGVAALKLLKDDAPKGERAVLVAIDTLQSCDEAGASGDATYALRRTAGADDESGCRL